MTASTDSTIEVAQSHSQIIVRHNQPGPYQKKHLWRVGKLSLAGADIIVNTTDNQYSAEIFPSWLADSLLGRAEASHRARPIWALHTFPKQKLLQNWGVGWCGAVSTNIPDAPSGFHQSQCGDADKYLINIPWNDYSGWAKGMAVITSVPIKNRRVFKTFAPSQSIPAYIQRSILTILRIFMLLPGNMMLVKRRTKRRGW